MSMFRKSKADLFPLNPPATEDSARRVVHVDLSDCQVITKPCRQPHMGRMQNPAMVALRDCDVVITNRYKMTEIPDHFMCECRLRSAVLTKELSCVTRVGKRFLSYTNIEALDLEPLRNVTHIGDEFLSNNCFSTDTIDFTPLVNVVHFGNAFMYHNWIPIDRVDISFISKDVRHIGRYFLGSSQIKSVDVSALRRAPDDDLVIDSRFFCSAVFSDGPGVALVTGASLVDPDSALGRALSKDRAHCEPPLGSCCDALKFAGLVISGTDGIEHSEFHEGHASIDQHSDESASQSLSSSGGTSAVSGAQKCTAMNVETTAGALLDSHPFGLIGSCEDVMWLCAVWLLPTDAS